MNQERIREFFRQQTEISDPGKYGRYFDALPSEPEEIVRAVQGLVIHAEHTKLYGVTAGKLSSQDELLRTTQEMLGAIMTTAPYPLNMSREPKHRLISMCRDSALLTVSILRHKNIPARVRAGYANYFDSKIKFEDHWICEYYSEREKRWIRVDTQLDEVQKQKFNINFNTYDMPVVTAKEAMEKPCYLTAAEVFGYCYNRELNPDDFGFNESFKGWTSIKSNLLHELNCFTGYELLPWDLCSTIAQKTWSNVSTGEKRQLKDIDDRLQLVSNIEGKAGNLPAEDYPDYLKSAAGDFYYREIDSMLSVIYDKTTAIKGSEFEAVSLTDEEAEIESSEEKVAIKDEIRVIGARQNNLKNVSVSIPKNKLTVITGPSGSGKSSIAFDTIYSEGRRIYLSNLSVRDTNSLEKPEFDEISGLTPVIAIEQKKGSLNPRSTVGTLSGTVDYIRSLYATIGVPHCTKCLGRLDSLSKQKLVCPECSTIYQKLNTSFFNSNTHIGACPKCNGLGYIYAINPESIVVDENKSILDGATSWWGNLRGRKLTGNWMVGEMYAVAAEMKVNLELPYKELPKEFKKMILEGEEGKFFTYSYTSSGREVSVTKPSTGAYTNINRLFREASNEENPYMQYMTRIPCNECENEKLTAFSRYTTIAGWRFPQVTGLSVKDLRRFVNTLRATLDKADVIKVQDVLKEIEKRCKALIDIGLYYLDMNRTAPSLSGGEIQRIRLAAQLGSDLTGITYILDEPSIGLHKKNHELMISTMKKLRDKGNTVIVVEHDADTMLAADYLVDVGPGAGKYGGKIVVAGDVNTVMNSEESITGKYLREKRKPLQPTVFDASHGNITISGCCENNLKNVTASFPKSAICCVAGVSGSGKSSLVFDTLVPAASQYLKSGVKKAANYESISGLGDIDDIICMDQSPIGKSSRSTPVTYLGIFDEIRKLFAGGESAKKEGFTNEKYFSFNTAFGQCETCEGTGELKQSFPYMPDHYVQCPACQGKRYRDEILAVTYKGKNIADVLAMDVKTAAEFFAANRKINEALETLSDVGLSYIGLNQNTSTLSGGEAQRLRLAKELCSKSCQHILYVFDEPSTGLHMSDIEKLWKIFERLRNQGHTIIIVEHNTEIIRNADYVIDMGPCGGAEGGQVVTCGTPYELSRNTASVTGGYLE